MAKFQFVSVDLYNHFFSQPQVVEGTDVVDATAKYYEDEDLRPTLQAELDKNNHEFPGLATNTEEGTWRVSGEETIILITQLPE